MNVCDNMKQALGSTMDNINYKERISNLPVPLRRLRHQPLLGTTATRRATSCLSLMTTNILTASPTTLQTSVLTKVITLCLTNLLITSLYHTASKTVATTSLLNVATSPMPNFMTTSVSKRQVALSTARSAYTSALNNLLINKINIQV